MNALVQLALRLLALTPLRLKKGPTLAPLPPRDKERVAQIRAERLATLQSTPIDPEKL